MVGRGCALQEGIRDHSANSPSRLMCVLSGGPGWRLGQGGHVIAFNGTCGKGAYPQGGDLP